MPFSILPSLFPGLREERRKNLVSTLCTCA